MSFDFLKIYDIGQQDTAFQFLASVNQATTEVEGGSLGISLLNSGSLWADAVSANTFYTIQKDHGELVLNFEQLNELVNEIARVRGFMSALEGNNKKDNPQVASVEVGGLLFFAEHTGGSEMLAKTRYFVRIGEATFTFSPDEFFELWRTLGEIRKLWTSRVHRSCRILRTIMTNLFQ